MDHDYSWSACSAIDSVLDALRGIFEQREQAQSASTDRRRGAPMAKDALKLIVTYHDHLRHESFA